MKILIAFMCACVFVVHDVSPISMHHDKFIVSPKLDIKLLLPIFNIVFDRVEEKLTHLTQTISSNLAWARDVLKKSVLEMFPSDKPSEKLCFNFNTIHEDGYTFLMLESYRGNIKAVQFLLALKADVNAVAKNGKTALILASMAGHDQIVELLLKHNANFDQTLDYGINALMIAAVNGYEKTVEVFLQNDIHINKDIRQKHNALTLAVYRNHTHIVKLFLEYSIIKNIKLGKQVLSQSLLTASNQGNTAIVDLLLNYISDDESIALCALLAFSKYQHSVLEVYFKHYQVDSLHIGDSTLLSYAAFKGDDKNMKFLLKHKANASQVLPSAYDFASALMIAATKGHISTVNLLLKHNANVNYISKKGVTALLLAINRDYDKIVELLLQNKAKVNMKSNGDVTALMFAVDNSSRKIVEILLKYGANVDHFSKKGYTALIGAAKKGRNDIVELLLEHKANVHQKDFEYGRNALMFASYEGHYNTAKLLLQHGAMVDDVNIFGYTSLMAAAERGHDLVVELLLAHGADVNKVHMFNGNALMAASSMGHLTTVKLLLKHNASTSQINEFGQTALDIAVQQNYTEIVELLRQYTAPQDVSHHEISDQQMSPETRHSLSPDTDTSSSTLTVAGNYEDDSLLLSYNHLFLQLLLFILVVSVISTYFIQTDPDDANFRTFFNLSAEVAKFTKNNSTLMKKLRSTFTESSVKTTEPKLICSLFGLNELFESYLLQLDIGSIRHQSLDFYIQRWLKTTVQAIEETDQSASLYECMLRIGLSQEMASTYLENLSQEFINMYSSLYWLSRYFKNLASVNPLITNLPRSCVFDGEMGVWETREVRRDGQTFTIQVLNEKSFPVHDRHGRDLTCDRINRYLKKKKSADYIYLYHGTSLASAEKIVVSRGIDLRQGSKNLDFSHGTGFYVINYLPKCIEWSSNARPENHAIIIYKVSKTEMEKRNGLILDNEEQWGRVIKACRSGFKGEIGSEVEDELEEYEYVRGYICSNGRAIEKDAAVPLQVMQEIVEGDVPCRPLQTCILKKKCAVWFNSNIFGVVVYRTH
ncbi:uncharacterized protein LOC131932457 [Physella acuta]|uniref:uncharacterized protein LOC131932457 n=1 Tax=Physella acuta TaxID=109671 RepID=UPI0027DD00E8|nr:uncharacterized protein LOC131932457 [Physella acuta]